MSNLNINVIHNVGDTFTWEFDVVNGQFANDNVQVTFNIPPEFTVINYNYLIGTVTGLVWNIGPMAANSSATIIVTLKLTGTPDSFEESYELEAHVTADLNGSIADDTIDDTITYILESTEPLAGAEDDDFMCLCGDVSLNDTLCSQGNTEWRFNIGSLVNGEMEFWESCTGKYRVVAIDNSKEISFTYSLLCVDGTDEYVIDSEVRVTIPPQIVSKDIYNHTLTLVKGSNLTTAMTTVLTAQYPGKDLTLNDWNILTNGDDEITSGTPQPILKELSGVLCDEDGVSVFLWNENGIISFKLVDGTDFLGNVGNLHDCCCLSNSGSETTESYLYKFIIKELDYQGIVTDSDAFPITMTVNGVDNVINVDASWGTVNNYGINSEYARLISQVTGVKAYAIDIDNIVVEFSDSFTELNLRFKNNSGAHNDELTIVRTGGNIIFTHLDTAMLSEPATNCFYYTDGLNNINRNVDIPLNDLK